MTEKRGDGKKRDVRFGETPEEVEYFDFSPDQTRVAYVTRSSKNGAVELKVADRAFRNPTAVAQLGVIPKFGTMEGRNNTGVWPRWSPDGRMIAYYRNIGKMELHVMAADGGWDQIVKTGDLDIDQNRGPAEWSADGTKLAMTLVGTDRGEIGVLKDFLPKETVAAK